MNFKLLIGLSSLLTAVLAVPAGPAVPAALDTRYVEDEVTFRVYSKKGCPESDESLTLNVQCGETQNIMGYQTGTRSVRITGYGGETKKLKGIQACFSTSPDGSSPSCATLKDLSDPSHQCVSDDSVGQYEYVTFVCLREN